ncbi:LamG domain-containing protein [Myxococcota bacterium]|nr:LamG domain-containing protein [Myxococcota bacterium]
MSIVSGQTAKCLRVATLTSVTAAAALACEGTEPPAGLEREDVARSVQALEAPLYHWSFEDCTGGVVPNEGTSNKNLYLEYGASCAPGLIGDAGSFEGGLERAYTTSDHWPAVIKGMTIQAWVSPDAFTTTTQSIVRSPNRFDIAIRNGQLEADLTFRTPGAPVTRRLIAPAFTGWHHVALLADPGKVELYVDGVLQDSALGHPTWSFDTRDPRIYVSHILGQYEGQVDELKLHLFALYAQDLDYATACGYEGLVCCSGGTCATGLVCDTVTDTCERPCGDVGQVCCNGSVCGEGLVCNPVTVTCNAQ